MAPGRFGGLFPRAYTVGKPDGAERAAGEHQAAMRSQSVGDRLRSLGIADLVLRHRAREADGPSEERLARDAEQRTELFVRDPGERILGKVGERRPQCPAEKTAHSELAPARPLGKLEAHEARCQEIDTLTAGNEEA